MKDAAGNLVAVVEACGEDLVNLELTRARDAPASAASAAPAAESDLLVRRVLDGSQSPRVVIAKVADLDRDYRYRLGAWDEPQSVVAGPIYFHASDLEALAVGNVLSMPSLGRRGETDPRGLPLEQWSQSACRSPVF